MVRQQSLLTIAFVFIVLSQAWGQRHKYEWEGVTKLPYGLNSDAEESKPLVAPDGSVVYFTRTFHPRNVGGKTGGQDIWFIDKDPHGYWNNPSNDINLNDEGNNTVVGISEDARTLYVMGTYKRKDQGKKTLHSSYRELEEWMPPEVVELPKLEFTGEFQDYWVSPEGDVLLISMNGPGSLGEEDLYISFLEAGAWTDPLHMGDSVNSIGYEFAPFLADHGKTLFFSSNMHNSMGEADIFVCRRKDDTYASWTEPHNLGEGINSNAFDAYFSISEKGDAYFVSNRDGGFTDLYVTGLVKRVPLTEASPPELARTEDVDEDDDPVIKAPMEDLGIVSEPVAEVVEVVKDPVIKKPVEPEVEEPVAHAVATASAIAVSTSAVVTSVGPPEAECVAARSELLVAHVVATGSSIAVATSAVVTSVGQLEAE